MNINEFIDTFYADSNFEEQVVNDSKKIKSQYSTIELTEHQKVLDKLYFEMLFSRITNEIYPKKININLKEKLS